MIRPVELNGNGRLWVMSIWVFTVKFFQLPMSELFYNEIWGKILSEEKGSFHLLLRFTSDKHFNGLGGYCEAEHLS